MLATLSLAALLAKSTAMNAQMPAEKVILQPAAAKVEFAVELRPMSDEDKAMFPGRERFDKTEWYESVQKTVQTVILPEYVAEWQNNGRDVS